MDFCPTVSGDSWDTSDVQFVVNVEGAYNSTDDTDAEEITTGDTVAERYLDLDSPVQAGDQFTITNISADAGDEIELFWAPDGERESPIGGFEFAQDSFDSNDPTTTTP